MIKSLFAFDLSSQLFWRMVLTFQVLVEFRLFPEKQECVEDLVVRISFYKNY